MSAKNNNKQTKKQVEKKSSSPMIPEKYRDAVYIGLMALLVLIFFWDGIFGGTIIPHDKLASYSFNPVYEQAAEEGVYPLWTPHIFGGMPGFSSFVLNADRPWNFFYFLFLKITNFVGELFDNDIARIASYYMIMGAGMYLLMRNKLKDRFISFLVSVALVFSTGIIVWGMIGHNTKIIAFAMLPFMFIFVERLRERFKLLDFALLIIITHILFSSNHVQMIFYAGLALFLYLVFELISRALSKRKPGGVLRAGALLGAAATIAFFMSSDKYLSVFDYTPHSTRGKGSIVKSEDAKTTADGGNDYDYATGWSFSPAEMIDILVPNFHGFGQLEYEGSATRGEKVKLPTYWGQKPFEDVAPYMGIFIFLLAIYGFITNRRDIFVQFLMFLSIFALILSFGYTMPLLYDFFYYNVPQFNKFRAPSMALALMQFAFPVMAGYGLKTMIEKGRKGEDPKEIRNLFIAAFSFLGLGLITVTLFKGSYLSAVSESPNSYIQNYLGQIQDLPEFLFSKMSSDWLIGAGILIAALLLIRLYSKEKVSQFAFYTLILGLLLFDLWRVDWRRLEVQEKVSLDSQFPTTDLVNYLQKDEEIFRIADLTATGGSNHWAYHDIQSIGGYSAAKMRNWQDISDYCGNGSTGMIAHPFLWNLFNVKYIITDRELGMQPIFRSCDERKLVYLNPTRLARAEFVDRTEIAEPVEILEHLKQGDFDPRTTAFIEEKLPQNIDPAGEKAQAEVTEYKLHSIKFDVTATGNNLLLLSEMYYSNRKAFIDGKETELIKTNYAFSSVIIPKGKHTLEIKYIDKAFETGKTISLILSILVGSALIIGIYFERKRKTND